MPIPLGAVMSLITQYTPTGSGTSSAPEAQYFQNQRQQKINNANYDRQFSFQKSIQDFSQDQKKDTDRRALLTALQAAMDSGDKGRAAMIVAELEGEHGLTMKERAAVTQAQADLATSEPQTQDAPPGEASTVEPETVPGASKADATAEGAPGWLTDYMAGQEPPDSGQEPPGWLTSELGARNELPEESSDKSQLPALPVSPVQSALARGAPASEHPADEYDIIDMATGKVRFTGSRGKRLDTEGFYRPATGAARTEEEAQIGAAAREIAKNLAQGGMAPEEALKVAEAWRTGELNRTAKIVAGGRGPGGGRGMSISGTPISGAGGETPTVGGSIAEAIAGDRTGKKAALYRTLQMDIRNWWSTDERAKQLAKIHQGRIAMDAALKNARNAKTNQEVGQFVAQIIKAVNTGVATEGDVERIVNRSHLDQLEASARRLVGGGHFTPAQVQGMIRAAEAVAASHKKYQQDMAASAAQVVGEVLKPTALAVHEGLRDMPAEAIYALVMGQSMPNIMGGEKWVAPHERAAPAQSSGVAGDTAQWLNEGH